jgi:GntR family transcriptional regulator
VREHVVFTFHAHSAERLNREAVAAVDAFHSEVAEQGRVPSLALEVQVMPASAEIAAKLEVEEGETVVVRRILRYVDSRAWSLQFSYYPMDISVECGLLSHTDVKEGVVRLLAKHGHVEVQYSDEINARMPTPDEARMLDIEGGVPVMVLTRCASSDARPLRLSETVFPADRNRIVYELAEA